MKITGASSARPTKKIALACGVEVTVTAPPVGLFVRAAEAVPPVSPPQKFVKSAESAFYVPNKHDPSFVRREQLAGWLQQIYAAWEVLQSVPEIDFEQKVAEGKRPDKAFVERLRIEIEEGPLTGADIRHAVEFAAECEGVTKEELDRARGFSVLDVSELASAESSEASPEASPSTEPPGLGE